MPGPIPMREAELARPREDTAGKAAPVVTKGVLREVRVPNASREWHPIARRVYDSFKTSGMADFYQNSDWAMIYSLCDDLSYVKNQGNRRSAQMLQTIYSGFESLGIAEGDRRRMRIELHEPQPEEKPAELVAIASYRADLELDDDDTDTPDSEGGD